MTETTEHDLDRHWADDPTDDIAWGNYQRGHDAAEAWPGDVPYPDLDGHSTPYVDGFYDGWITRIFREASQ